MLYKQVKLFTVFKISGLPGLAMFHLKVLENPLATELPETLVQVLRKFDHSIFNGFAQRGVDMNEV